MAEHTQPDLNFRQRLFISLLPVILATVFSLMTQVALFAYFQGQNSVKLASMQEQVNRMADDVQRNYVSRERFDGSIEVRDEQYKEIIRRIDELGTRLKK